MDSTQSKEYHDFYTLYKAYPKLGDMCPSKEDAEYILKYPSLESMWSKTDNHGLMLWIIERSTRSYGRESIRLIHDLILDINRIKEYDSLHRTLLRAIKLWCKRKKPDKNRKPVKIIRTLLTHCAMSRNQTQADLPLMKRFLLAEYWIEEAIRFLAEMVLKNNEFMVNQVPTRDLVDKHLWFVWYWIDDSIIKYIDKAWAIKKIPPTSFSSIIRKRYGNIRQFV